MNPGGGVYLKPLRRAASTDVAPRKMESGLLGEPLPVAGMVGSMNSKVPLAVGDDGLPVKTASRNRTSVVLMSSYAKIRKRFPVASEKTIGESLEQVCGGINKIGNTLGRRSTISMLTKSNDAKEALVRIPLPCSTLARSNGGCEKSLEVINLSPGYVG